MRATLPSAIDSSLTSAALSDEALVGRIRAGKIEEFALIMRRYNQRLFRVARAITRDSSEAEDVVQHGYLSAYAHLHQFAGHSAFSTWLTRIVINEALARYRAQRRVRDLESGELAPDWCAGASLRSPEDDVSRAELVDLLETAIDSLPETYRAIIVLRELEGLSTQEAAECLSISEEAARVRLHRARTLLREALWQRVGAAADEVFSFGGERCNRIVERVLARIRAMAD
jgi:RNA polymerase sigma-70 factor (ECF subfamily)